MVLLRTDNRFIEKKRGCFSCETIMFVVKFVSLGRLLSFDVEFFLIIPKKEQSL